MVDRVLTVVTVVFMLYAVWWGMDKSFAMGRTIGQFEACRGPAPISAFARR